MSTKLPLTINAGNLEELSLDDSLKARLALHSINDADAGANTLYYSLDAGEVVYKNPLGVVESIVGGGGTAFTDTDDIPEGAVNKFFKADSLKELAYNNYMLTDLATQAADALDDRIEGLTAGSSTQDIFSSRDTSTKTYVRNTGNFAADLDLTCISANVSAGIARNGTLISPRHVLFAAHAGTNTGYTIDFVTSDNITHTRTVSANETITGTDILIGVLDSDLPDTISYAKVMDIETLAQFSAPVDGNRPPLLYTDRNFTTNVFELKPLTELDTYVTFDASDEPKRLEFWTDIESGDSGKGAFIVSDGELIVLSAFHFGGTGGSGPSVSYYLDEINAAMTNLGGGYQLDQRFFRLLPSTLNYLTNGAANATDNGIVRFDGDSGYAIQDSAAFLDDSGNLTATSLRADDGGKIVIGGSNASVSAGSGLAIGSGVTASNGGTAIGYTTVQASNTGALAIGAASVSSSGLYSSAIGSFCTATGTGDVSIGLSADSSGGNSIAIGQSVAVTGNKSVIIGHGVSGTVTNSTDNTLLLVLDTTTLKLSSTSILSSYGHEMLANGDMTITGAITASNLGTASAEDVGYFATAAQGTLADSALQAGDITGLVPYTGADSNIDLNDKDITNVDNISATSANLTEPLVITKTAETGVRERLLTAKVSDASSTSFFINNGTVGNGNFAPVFGGYTESTSLWALGFSGYLPASSDSSDSSTFGIIDVSGFRTTDANDALNGSLSAIENRKLFTIRNYTNIYMEVAANGLINFAENVTIDGDIIADNIGTASASDVDDFATGAEGDLATTAVQPGDNISDLSNDSGYVNDVSGLVPYTGASSDVDLGFYDINAQSAVIGEANTVPIYLGKATNNAYSGMWFTDDNATTSNYTFLFGANNTFLNTPVSGGLIQFRESNQTILIAGRSGVSVNHANSVTPTDAFSVKRDYNGITAFTVGTDGKVGIDTEDTQVKLQVGDIVNDFTAKVYDENALLVTHPTPASNAVLNDPQDVLYLRREGTGGQAFPLLATYKISRFENVSALSRTRLDLDLADGNYTDNNVMTWLSSGNVGFGVTNPEAAIHTSGDAIIEGTATIKGLTTMEGDAAIEGDVSVVGDTSTGTLTVITPAVSGREELLTAKISQGLSKFGVGNLTSSNNLFLPAFYGFNNDDSRSGIAFLGLVNTNNDLSSTLGAIDFNVGMVAPDSTDPLNAGRGPLTVHPLATFRNDSGKRVVIEANGDIDTVGDIIAAGDAIITGAITASNLGTASAEDVGYFATAAQGTLADSALQAGDITGLVPYTGATSDLDLGSNDFTAEIIKSTNPGSSNYVQFSSVSDVANYPRAGFLIGDVDDSFTNGAMWVAPAGTNQITTTIEALTNSDTSLDATKRLGIRATATEAQIYSARGTGSDADTPITIYPNGLTGTASTTFNNDGTVDFADDVDVAGALTVAGDIIGAATTVDSLQIGATPNYNAARALKLYDNGVQYGSRLSLIGTGDAAYPGLEFVTDGDPSKRTLIRHENTGTGDYGLYFYTTNNGAAGEAFHIDGNKNAVFAGPVSASNLGTASAEDVGYFATAAQGTLADSALQLADLSTYAEITYVDTQITNLIDSSPGALDTLNELAAALGDDANFSSTVNTNIAAKLAKTSNLSDLSDVTIARTNLGLGSAAVEDVGYFATAAQGTLADSSMQKITTVDNTVFRANGTDGTPQTSGVTIDDNDILTAARIKIPQNSGVVDIGRNNLGGTQQVTNGVGIGANNDVTNIAAVAIGFDNNATTMNAIAMGLTNNVTGVFSTGIGSNNTVSNTAALAIGTYNTASAVASTVIGLSSFATAQNAMAMGAYATADVTGAAVMGVGTFSTPIVNSISDSLLIGRPDVNFLMTATDITYSFGQVFTDTGGIEIPDDLEVTDATKGVVLKSPDGTRWRLTVDNNGALSTTSL